MPIIIPVDENSGPMTAGDWWMVGGIIGAVVIILSILIWLASR